MTAPLAETVTMLFGLLPDLGDQLAQIAGSETAWSNQSRVDPIGLAVLLVAGIAQFLAPRKWAVTPMILVACLVPVGQRIALGGIDFNFVRLMVLFGWARLLVRGELKGFRLNALDLALILWACCTTAIFTAQQGSTGALINRLGSSYDAVGGYLFFRVFIRSWSDIARIGATLAVVSIPVVMFFTVEQFTGRNLFATMGGVPEETLFRNGRRRAQGAFSHPITAGCFWAAALPLIASLWWGGRGWRKIAFVGLIGAFGTIVMCASSTPVAAVGAAAFGALLFKMRKNLPVVRYSILFLLVVLHFIREKPVWHLIGRIDIVGGSTGYHRYLLIDNWIRHFGDWFFLGVPDTTYWGHQMQDVTNQYVLESVRGGFLTFAVFVTGILIAFNYVGKAVRRVEGHKPRMWLVWGVGVSLFVHTVSFFAVSYFGQIMLMWYLSLALAACLPGLVADTKKAKANTETLGGSVGHSGQLQHA